MTERDDYQEMYAMSRSEKVMAAKQAFAEGGNDSEQYSTRQSFWLLRFMTAGVIFFIMVLAIYNGFSYYGFDRNYIENCLSDGRYYDMILRWVGKTATEIIKIIQ